MMLDVCPPFGKDFSLAALDGISCKGSKECRFSFAMRDATTWILFWSMKVYSSLIS